MTLFTSFIRPILFRFDPEKIHDWTLKALGIAPLGLLARNRLNPRLSSHLAGLNFLSPVGLAAGFDKDARVFSKMYSLGFGSVEVGTLTPQPQFGNELPRIQRLEAHGAIVNRMGFPNDGIKNALGRIASFLVRPGPLGVNIGANKDTVDKTVDYVSAYRAVGKLADYVTVNVSSPNTPGLRLMEQGDGLRTLLRALDSEIDFIGVPIFIKVSPDLDETQIQDTCEAILNSKIAGIIVGNTTTTRPGVENDTEIMAGGLSGKPLADLSVQKLSIFYRYIGNAIPIVSVGGISSANDAYERILSGASLVQIYTSLIYEGPFVVRRMNAGLARLLERDGYESIGEAIGRGTLPAVKSLSPSTPVRSKARGLAAA